uniref:HDC12856 n=1 Tax=Drosophila melanogaster TaxID=7227 RepID=Q6IKD1_DROME|nr:TPA_inf: HDC12856 [Drosophila melanogaster]
MSRSRKPTIKATPSSEPPNCPCSTTLLQPAPSCTTFLTQPSLALRWRSTSHKVHDRTLENTRAPAKPTPPHEEQENLDARRVVCGGVGAVGAWPMQILHHHQPAPPASQASSSSRHHLHLASEAGERLS